MEDIIPAPAGVVNEADSDQAGSRRKKAFARFFSIESDKVNKFCSPELNRNEGFQSAFCTAEFFLKLAQLLLGIICAGLYSEGLKVMIDISESSLMFPNVVFSSFIMITSVIVMSYVLGQIMPPVLVRIFNSIGTILYFVATCVTGSVWYFHGRFIQGEKSMPALLLLVQTVVSGVNTLLYGYDMYVNVRNVIKEVEIV